MRRGFALPIVIVLALIVGIVAAVVLERQGAQRQIVARQLYGYQDTHFERGVREVVGQWTDSLIGQPLEKMIAPDGHALDIQRPDGSLISIYLFDGQGTVLTELAGLSGTDAADAEGVLNELRSHHPGDIDPAIGRPVGPARVCAASAPGEVLEAVGAYAKGGKNAHRFVQSLMDARTRGSLTDADLAAAMSAVDMTADQQNVAKRLLVLKPELWNTVVDVYVPRNGGELVTRYGGRFMLSNFGGGTAPGRVTTMVSLGKFLWWERLPTREEESELR